jgi:glycosyltransferase involved in cell wall biosynthesis
MSTSGVTVAIPTMRRWKGFLEKSLPLYLANPLIAHVVVCDETGEDAAAIAASSLAGHPKLTVYVNPQRLGAYHNKRQCIEKAPTDWVAVLDSDNIFPEEFFEVAMETLEKEQYNPKLILVSGINIRLFVKTGQQEERTAHFKGLRITRNNWNRVLEMPAWNFLLNDGNYIVHKTTAVYLSPSYTLAQVQAADAILAAKQFVEHGCSYFIVPDMRYIHTVHDDSEWLKTDRESTRILNTTDWRIFPEN